MCTYDLLDAFDIFADDFDPVRTNCPQYRKEKTILIIPNRTIHF